MISTHESILINVTWIFLCIPPRYQRKFLSDLELELHDRYLNSQCLMSQVVSVREFSLAICGLVLPNAECESLLSYGRCLFISDMLHSMQESGTYFDLSFAPTDQDKAFDLPWRIDCYITDKIRTSVDPNLLIDSQWAFLQSDLRRIGILYIQSRVPSKQFKCLSPLHY